MKKELIYCDICGKTDALTCSFYVDRCLDAAGSSDDVFEYLDLCPKHQWEAYKIAEKERGFSLAKHVYNTLLNKTFAYRRSNK